MAYDVLIIGAGAAGLAAAGVLARAGCAALVLEARARIGGRIYPRQVPGLALPVELGAEFIHGRAAPTFDLLARTGGAAIDSARERYTLREGRLETGADTFGEVRAAMLRSKALAEKDMSFSEFLDRHLAAELSAATLAQARMRVEGYDAADPARASARAIVAEWTSGNGADIPQFRPLGGHASVLQGLERALAGSSVNIQLQTVVHSVRWRRGEVEVTGSHFGQPFSARASRAIVTLPLGVLKARAREPGAVRFSPPLVDKREALAKLAAGPVLKVALHFRSAFWEAADGGRYRNASFFHSPLAPFPTFWTTLPVRTPLIVAWAGGPRVARLSQLSSAEVIEQAAASFAALFSRTSRAARALEGAWLHDWQTDPYARGAYSHALAGANDAVGHLARPLGGTLFFAGEAADTEGEAGTVAGALQSGERAAREALGL